MDYRRCERGPCLSDQYFLLCGGGNALFRGQNPLEIERIGGNQCVPPLALRLSRLVEAGREPALDCGMKTGQGHRDSIGSPAAELPPDLST